MEDDETEWQIRVGDPSAPQPAWAKRKQEAEGSDQGANKRQRTGYVVCLCDVVLRVDILS